MNSISLTMPDEFQAVVVWLERQIVGSELRQLVGELKCLSAGDGLHVGLSEIIGNKREQVLDEGLASLTPSEIRGLLRQPTLLFELQEMVVFNGGVYWQEVANRHPDFTSDSANSREQAILSGLPRFETGSRTEAVETVLPERTDSIRLKDQIKPVVDSGRLRSRSGLRWVALLATISAMLVFGIILPSRFRNPVRQVDQVVIDNPQKSWGWNRTERFSNITSSDKYLSEVALGAEEWFQEAPHDSQSADKRLSEMLDGCKKLIASTGESPLNPDDREWLVEKCTKWLKNFESDLARLQSTPEEWASQFGPADGSVADSVNGRVRGLIGKIRERAELSRSSSAS